jgi:hypothetical protein
MKAWYVPTWHGDVRIEPAADDPKHACTMSVFHPTPEERDSLSTISKLLVERKWLDKEVPPEATDERIRIEAPIEEVGPLLAAALRQGPGVLSALHLRNGRVEVVEHNPIVQATEADLKKLAKKPAKAAATVRRPTPCCPDCYVDAVKPATQSLLAFLTPEQHKTWAAERYVVCRGGLTGHRYILAHRSSEIAAKNERICWDVEDKDILHFHDQSVPPEEEVLASMLILQHREPWLRNEATCLGVRFQRVFKNPFGDHLDGVMDASLTKAMGAIAMALMAPS